jgi:hypothetical protein
MAPKIEHLLDSSCYSITYPPSESSELDTIPHSGHSPTGTGTGTIISQQHSSDSSPFFDLPPYYPGSQHTLSLEEHDVSGPTQFSEPDTTSLSPARGSESSDYFLAAPLPPYYPVSLTDSLGIVLTNPNIINHSSLPHYFLDKPAQLLQRSLKITV